MIYDIETRPGFYEQRIVPGGQRWRVGTKLGFRGEPGKYGVRESYWDRLVLDVLSDFDIDSGAEREDSANDPRSIALVYLAVSPWIECHKCHARTLLFLADSLWCECHSRMAQTTLRNWVKSYPYTGRKEINADVLEEVTGSDREAKRRYRDWHRWLTRPGGPHGIKHSIYDDMQPGQEMAYRRREDRGEWE